MSVTKKYLSNYAEQEARTLLANPPSLACDFVLVIPAFAESPDFLDRLPKNMPALVVLVINRPDTESDATCNDRLRQQVSEPQVPVLWSARHMSLCQLKDDIHVLVVERPDALPHRQGVGLARKIGCDVALALGESDCVRSRWIHCSDADAKLPERYFQASNKFPDAVGLVYPFRHQRPKDIRARIAMEVYEQHLNHYVAGLSRASSPYAFHTLGSCIAVDRDAYAKVRGFPRRAGGEDFYLLNKLAKLGEVTRPDCEPLLLSSRQSQRAPFGTGPALGKLLAQSNIEDHRLFYDPECFEKLARFIGFIQRNAYPGMRMESLTGVFDDDPVLASVVLGIGLENFLEHAKRHSTSQETFRRQFHQWFDAFRTLKFVHAVSDVVPRISKRELDTRMRRSHRDREDDSDRP
ncbi:MAG: hypothetical protein Cons2KO_24440 [Congregibacter sp.]